jgi:hypothetical protein
LGESAATDGNQGVGVPASPPLTWGGHGGQPVLSIAARKAVDAACRYYDRFFEEERGLVRSDLTWDPDSRSTFLCAMSLMLSGRAGGRIQAGRLLDNLIASGDDFDVPLALLALYACGPILEEGVREGLRRAVERAASWEGEDIIAGRNINIPLATWTGRIGAGVLFQRPDLVSAGAEALEGLIDIVKDHGTIPEFNSPTYHPITLMLLRTICLLGEPRISTLAGRLERHLWRELAWRWHPRLRQICGPWSRAYLDTLVGGSGMLLMLADIVWGAFYDETVAYRYGHAHDHSFGGALTLLASQLPALGLEGIALEKELPLTVTSSAEQVAFRFGDGARSTWVPGGVADLMTWMDENTAVGTSSRPHIHGLQGAGYVAQWTRTGKPVERLADLGQAFTKFVQNARRPCQSGCLIYDNHHLGNAYVARSNLWPENGLSFVLQSGPTALVAYVPKGQERWKVQRLEGMVILPRPDTVDGVFVDGEQVREHRGTADSHVLVRSGAASLGLRMASCDPELCKPRLFVERERDFLLIGLRTADFETERELDEHSYRRYGVSIGAELRFTPSEDESSRMLKDLSASLISDQWPMAVFGGPREVTFEIGRSVLYGRLDPISGAWLSRRATKPPGRVERIRLR